MNTKSIVGIDDGSSGIKIYDGKSCLKIESTGRAGMSNQIALAGHEAVEFTYKNKNGEFYTVGDVIDSEQTDYTGYQTSKLNQALVQHALNRAGIAGDNVFAVFSLPFSQYHKNNGEKNEALIEKKIKHIYDNSFANESSGIGVKFTQGNVKVLAEGLAAAFNRWIEIDKDGTIIQNTEELNKQLAIVDIGGNTLDICVAEAGRLLHKSSTSKGSSGVIEIIENSIKLLENLPTTQRYFEEETPYKSVRNAVKNGGQFKVGGKQLNVKPQIEQAKSIVADSIMATLRKNLGSGFSMDEIVFVGGGSEVLKKQLEKLFEDAKIEKDPEFANVKGLYKFARL